MEEILNKIKQIKLSGWISIALAVVVPVLTYFGLTAEDITTWSKLWDVIVQAISNPYVVFTMLGCLYGALQNPTTKGFLGWEDKNGKDN